MKVPFAKVELLRQSRKAGVTPFAMNKITQEMRFRQAVIEYSLKYGVTKAAIRYKTNRQYITALSLQIVWIQREQNGRLFLKKHLHKWGSHINWSVRLPPRHNGKVERSHRKDNEEFYASHKFYSFADFEKQLAVRQRQYNNFPMRPLNWQSPKTVLYSFPNV